LLNQAPENFPKTYQHFNLHISKERKTMTNLCAVALGTPETTSVSVDRHTIDAHKLLDIKRTNNLLSSELGLLCAVSGLTQLEALELTITAVVKRLLTRTPKKVLQEALGATYADYYGYQGYYPHLHLGRSDIDRSWPSGLEMLATPEQFIVMNILGAILRDDDAVEPFFLLLQEAFTAFLMLTQQRSLGELEALFGIPEDKEQTDNILVFSKVQTDTSYDPFAR
jgi:hypothetical protein